MVEVEQDSSKEGLPPELFALNVGDSVIENAFTNYDTLGMIISKYNDLVPSDQVDPAITDIRDLLAHGRTVAPIASLPCRIFKFSRPVNGQVTVTHAEDMTSEWLNQTNQHVLAELRKVEAQLRTEEVESGRDVERFFSTG